MSDDRIKFGTLHPDGTVSDERQIERTAIAACAHCILDPEHYRSNGTCRCDDAGHTVMREWGYSWNAETGRWIA